MAQAVAAIRLLALTGCRRGEVLNLRWQDIGEDEIKLPNSKTSQRAMPLGESARAPIDALPGPATRRATCFRDMPKAEVSGSSRTAGALSEPTRSSEGCGCATRATRPPATWSCRVKTCR